MRCHAGSRGLILTAAFALMSCERAPTPPDLGGINLSVISGNDQIGTPGAELPDPLVVKVTRKNGRPLKGQILNFRVVSGGGSVFGGTEMTDARGIAQERWTLGTESGLQRVEVRAVDNVSGEPLVFATFTATTQCDCWSSKAPMPTERAALGAAELNGKLYAVGGFRYTSTSVVIESANEEYDPLTNQWTRRRAMPTPRIGVGVAAVGGLLYVIGGGTDGQGDVGTVEVYDPATDSWSARTPMPTTRAHVSVAVVGGIIYVVGGWKLNVGVVATMEAYNPATNSWTTKASLPTVHATEVAVVNGIIYAVGGELYGGVATPVVEAYNASTDRWTTKASMPSGRISPGVGAIGGMIYVAGGMDKDYAFPAATLRYDPATNSWATKAPIPHPRFNVGYAVLNGVLYVVGGYSTTVDAYQP